MPPATDETGKVDQEIGESKRVHQVHNTGGRRGPRGVCWIDKAAIDKAAMERADRHIAAEAAEWDRKVSMAVETAKLKEATSGASGSASSGASWGGLGVLLEVRCVMFVRASVWCVFVHL